jgi:2-hydroxy-3-keto-5-methylthiopentenyl-1-phosphate phosphatase
MPVDLSTTSVFLDWDGTITLVDTGVHLLDRLAPESWRDIEAEYKSGAIGSRECLSRQWDLLPKHEQVLREVAGEVALDDGFPALVDALRRHGAEVTVVSDGYGFYAEGTCKQAPIRDAARRGRTTIFVGDGMSDRKAALLADVLFAKGDLAEWCEDVAQPFLRFSNLDDVQRSLGLR